MKSPRIPRVRFSVRLMLLAIALAAAFSHFVVAPTWRYYRLPPETRRVLGKLEMTMTLPAGGATPLNLGGFLKQVRATSVTGPKDIGIPIYLDPIGLQDAGSAMTATVAAPGGPMRIRDQLATALPPLGLGYYVKDGMLTITSAEDARAAIQARPDVVRRP